VLIRQILVDDFSRFWSFNDDRRFNWIIKILIYIVLVHDLLSHLQKHLLFRLRLEDDDSVLGFHLIAIDKRDCLLNQMMFLSIDFLKLLQVFVSAMILILLGLEKQLDSLFLLLF
jgi:hypothetical protein